MLRAQFEATNDAGWKEGLELINDETSQPLDEVATCIFAFEVSDCGSAVLSASSDDGSGILSKPGDGVVQWNFTKAQMGGLEARKTYAVGMTMTDPDDPAHPVQIMVASLAVIDGGF